MTTFDPRELDRLARDLSSDLFMLGFATKYHRLLPGRVARVTMALAEADLDQALDAVMSLRVASSIVGTHDLAAIAAAIEERLRDSDLLGAREASGPVADEAARADAALTSYLQEHGLHEPSRH